MRPQPEGNPAHMLKQLAWVYAQRGNFDTRTSVPSMYAERVEDRLRHVLDRIGGYGFHQPPRAVRVTLLDYPLE